MNLSDFEVIAEKHLTLCRAKQPKKGCVDQCLPGNFVMARKGYCAPGITC